MNAFSKVLDQIEVFIKKYYKNQMVKGVLIFLATFFVSYLVVSGLEYIGRFNSGVRLTLLILFVVLNSYLLGKYIIIPILRLLKVAGHLTIFEAAEMIGNIFPDIGDKLKNTLQLERDKQSLKNNLELVNASIEQRASKLSVVPFSQGIDITQNKRYLKYLLPALGIFTLVAVINPNWFIVGTERVVFFAQEFEEPAPFEFNLLSDEKAVQGEDYDLRLKLTGEDIPDQVKVISNKGTYNLKKNSAIEYHYVFKGVNEDLNFHFEANGFKSRSYFVDLLHKAILENVSLDLLYPKHTGLKQETIQNNGDISIPEGTIIKWNIKASNLDELSAVFNDTNIVLNSNISNDYNFKRQIFNSEQYKLLLRSKEVRNADTIGYNVNVVKDQYPKILIQERIDSTNNFLRFIEGQISDDYGFSQLAVIMKIKGNDSTYTVRKSIGIKGNVVNQIFAYRINIKDFHLKPGQTMEYYFVVTDNDAVNNYKSSSSLKQIFKVEELDQLENKLSEQDKDLEKEMEKALAESNAIKKKIQDLKSEMNNKKSLDWKDKQSLEDLLQMQLELDKKIEKLQNDFEKNKEEKQEFMENSEELSEKQEKLQELLNELMDDELKELFEELKELMDDMNKDDILEQLDEMEYKAEDLEKEMDRTLELFKNMELDQKLENLEQQLEDLAKEQEELAKQTENKELSPEELKEKQDELNKKFEEIQKDIDEIKEKNEELEKPRDLNFDEEMEQDTNEEMQNASEQLDNGKEKKASESQSKAAEMMKQMAEDAAAMQSSMSMEQDQENMDSLRYLLENLVSLSKQQEKLMEDYSGVSTGDPYYVELNRRQIDINQATEQVRDSLEALAKRVYQLEGYIMDEVSDLNYNLDKALIYGEERVGPKAQQHQQYAMTSYNDLALMLSEVLDQMQQSAAAKMQGNGSCNNPGGTGQSKPGEKPGESPGQMSMEQMKQALQDQINKMKNGQNPGGEEGKGQEGENGEGMGSSPGQNGMMPLPGGLTPKDIAKMAAQQEQIREQLKKLKEQLNKDGSGFGNELLNDLIQDIEEQEKDLVNGNVNQEFIRRQEEILTRLLESEKAIRERGYSEERESNEGKNDQEGNPSEFLEYNKKKNAEVEFLKSVPVGLQPYYKSLINEYFNAVNE